MAIKAIDFLLMSDEDLRRLFPKPKPGKIVDGSDEYYEAIGEIIDKYPIGHPRVCGPRGTNCRVGD